MWVRWYSTVFRLTNIAPATSRFDLPSATRRAIWSSCGVSRSGAEGSRGGTVSPVARSSARARSPGCGARFVEGVERDAQVQACLLAAVDSTQALAVAELGACTLERRAGPLAELERFREPSIDLVLLGEEAGAARSDCESPSAL